MTMFLCYPNSQLMSKKPKATSNTGYLRGIYFAAAEQYKQSVHQQTEHERHEHHSVVYYQMRCGTIW